MPKEPETKEMRLHRIYEFESHKCRYYKLKCKCLKNQNLPTVSFNAAKANYLKHKVHQLKYKLKDKKERIRDLERELDEVNK